MSSLTRLFVLLAAGLIPVTAFADELLRDLEELYELTAHCEEKSEVALRWGMVLRQSPMRSPERRALLESVYSRALEPCAPTAIRAQAIFELGIVAFGDGDFQRAKGYFTRLLNKYREDLLVVDGLYWLGETYSELGDLKRARRAYLGVAERSVGEMRGWGLFKSSRLVKSKSVVTRDLVRLLDLLSVSSEVSPKFRRSVADAFVADWSKATNQVRGGVRKQRSWRRLKGADAALLVRAMGRYYIGTSDAYAMKSLLASLSRLNESGWEFEERLWKGLLTKGTSWGVWFRENSDLLIDALPALGSPERLIHVVDVLEIAVGRSSQNGPIFKPEQLDAIDSWVTNAIDISNAQLLALLKLYQLGLQTSEEGNSILPTSVERLVTRCLEDEGRKLQCSAASLRAALELWSSRRSALERGMEGSQSLNEGRRLWDLLRRAIESRRVVFSREEELARLLEFAVVFKEPEGFSAYASLIPDDFPDPNCEITEALASVDRGDVTENFWFETRRLLKRLLTRGLGTCQKRARRLNERIEARLDLVSEVGRVQPETFISKHVGKAGLALILIADWRRVFEDGDLGTAQERMTRLLEDHGSEPEVRTIATEWGDWLERNNNWLQAAEHYQRVAERGGKAIGFYALSKSGRAYRLAGKVQLSVDTMRQAQERAISEMNGSGLEKICDYWWRQWIQGDRGAETDVRTCEQALLTERLGDRCESLVRVWSLPPPTPGVNVAGPPKVTKQDCEAAQWEGFLGEVRLGIQEVGSLELGDGADERQLAAYLESLESSRKAYAARFAPYLQAKRPVPDALALAYHYGWLHEALYEGLMRLEDPSLGVGQAALWRRKLTRRGEPLRSIALSAYQKALSLRSPQRIHPLESVLQEALLRLEALSTQPALDYLPLPGEQ